MVPAQMKSLTVANPTRQKPPWSLYSKQATRTPPPPPMTPTAAIRLRSMLSGLASNKRLVFLRFASSFSSLNPESSVVSPRNRTASIFEDQSDGGSAVYNHALKYSRPPTIKLWEQRSHLRNSVSLIGTVERTPTAYNRRGDDLGVYTMLDVKNSPNSESSVRIQIEMWDKIAKLALEHVKPGDYIYVSGRLVSYRSQDSSGNDRLRYKVIAKELNYVKQQHDENQRNHEVHQSKAQGASSMKNREDRLHLWQVFFTNPTEWHDWRKNKRNPRYPDFKHKSTGEVLWINADDPSWILRQLELLDSMVAAGCFEDRSSRRHVSSSMSDDL